MRTNISLLLAFFLVISMFPVRAQAQTNPNSSAAHNPSESDHPSWLFPVAKLDEVLPRWFHIGGEYRDRLEGPLGTGFANTSDFYVLDRLRVKIRIEPKDWLTFFGEVQDSRIFFNHHVPNANPFEDSWTLWQGYARVASSTSGWVDALAGRQVLLFGDERVIGPSNWLNVGRTFDVARIDIHHPGYEVAIFASSVVPGSNTFLHRAIPGNNFYGIYGSFHNIIPRATFEPYVLWRLAPGNFGLAGVGKAFPKVATAPRVFIEGNYASGTKNPAGRDWNTFDQLYPSSHDKFGFTDQVGRRNLVQFRVGVEESVGKKWKFKEAFEGFWVATSNDNFYASSGAISVPAHPGASRHIGNEVDLVCEYEFNKGLNFGFGYARLFAGQFLKTTTPGHDYSYPYAYVEYNFSKSGFHFPITPNKPN